MLSCLLSITTSSCGVAAGAEETPTFISHRLSPILLLILLHTNTDINKDTKTYSFYRYKYWHECEYVQ